MQNEILYLVNFSEKFGRNPHLSSLRASRFNPTTFEGWTITKEIPQEANEKASWVEVIRIKMPLSQDDLRTHVAKENKKGQSLTEQYSDPDMKGLKKLQVDLLLQDRNRDETDSRFVYELASLKLVQTVTEQTTRQTTAMQIILKRVYRPDNDRSLAPGPPKSFATAAPDDRPAAMGKKDKNRNRQPAIVINDNRARASSCNSDSSIETDVDSIFSDTSDYRDSKSQCSVGTDHSVHSPHTTIDSDDPRSRRSAEKDDIAKRRRRNRWLLDPLRRSRSAGPRPPYQDI